MVFQEIDLATGKPKESAPLRDGLNYDKWNSLAVRRIRSGRTSAHRVPVPASP